MTWSRARPVLVLATVGIGLCCGDAVGKAEEASPLQLETKIPLGDVKGRIDHLAVDLERHRLLVAALGNGSLEVVDLEAKRVDRSVHAHKNSDDNHGHDREASHR